MTAGSDDSSTSSSNVERASGMPHAAIVSRPDGSRVETSVLSGAVQATIFVGAIASIVIFGGLAKDSVVLGEVLTFCLATFVIFRFPEITKFKALGVEVEIERAREATIAATRATEDAKATVEQLRGLAATLGKLVLDQTGFHNRLGNLSPLALGASRDRVLRAMSEAGCTGDELRAARRLIDGSIRMALVDRISGALAIVESMSPPRPGLAKKCSDLRGVSFDPPPAAAFRKLVRGLDVTTPAVLSCVDDLERFEESGAIPEDQDEQYGAARIFE
jgi:hypothetical protein